jgi:two-component system KDP operon response regulator KdpE
MANETILFFQNPEKPNVAVLTALVRSGYSLYVASTPEEALERLKQIEVDLLIISLECEIADCPWCHDLRQATDAPILLLGPYEKPEVVVSALARGADVYLPDATAIIVIEAHIAALLRWRTQDSQDVAPQRRTPGYYRDERLIIDIERRNVLLEGREVTLTPKEFALLRCLLENAGRPVTYEQLLAAGWSHSEGDISAIHSHMSHLRHKLGDNPRQPRYIVGEYGVGYRFLRQK